MDLIERLKAFSSLVVLPHSVFALPFALAALLVATDGSPSPKLVGLVVLAMFLARTAAMAYNRLVDADIDAKNPRTQGRDIPSGRISSWQAKLLVLASGMGFVWTCSYFNRMTFLLATPVLVVLFLYSHTKRFTWASHFFLGLALGLAPLGAWIAALGHVDLAPFYLAAGVLCFVAGFDILYALQDEAFDRKEGLHSWVVKWGPGNAVWASRILHVAMIGFLAFFAAACAFPKSHFTLLGLVGAGLAWLHRMGYKVEGQGRDAKVFLSPKMMAYNGWIAVMYLAAVAATVFLIRIA
jgi:4-hydroxybenzoate polyprenyltransferase